jgi:hypothetical protein
MKTLTYRLIPVSALLVLMSQFAVADPLGTMFTYQGRLSSGGNAANGSYDLKCSLFDALTGGNQIGNSLTNAATTVTNGLFTVVLDFGSVFDSNARWLEIGVRASGGGAFTVLLPRQAIQPVPYALYAVTPAGPQGSKGDTGAAGEQGPQGGHKAHGV